MVMAETFTAIFIFILGLISFALSRMRKKAIVYPVLSFAFFTIDIYYALSIPFFNFYAANFVFAALSFMFALLSFIQMIRLIFEILKGGD